MGLIYRQLASTDLQNQWILEIRNQVYYTNLRCVCRCFIIIYHLTCRSREKKISLNSFNVKYKRTVCCTCLPCRHSDKFQGFFPYIQDVKGGFGLLITRRAFYPKWIDLGVLVWYQLKGFQPKASRIWLQFEFCSASLLGKIQNRVKSVPVKVTP